MEDQISNYSDTIQSEGPEEELSMNSKNNFYKCPECKGISIIPKINPKNDNREYSVECCNKHNIIVNKKNVLEIYKKMTNPNISMINCHKCKAIPEIGEIYNYCINPKNNEILCPLCKPITIPNDFITIQQYHTTCFDHKLPFVGYCFNCKENFCSKCESEKHKNSLCMVKEYFRNMHPRSTIVNQIQREICLRRELIKKEEQKVKEIIKEMEQGFEKLKKVAISELDLKESIINTYLTLKDNYYLIKNVTKIINSPTYLVSISGDVSKLLSHFFSEYSLEKEKQLQVREKKIKDLLSQLRINLGPSGTVSEDLGNIEKLLNFNSLITIKVDIKDKDENYQCIDYGYDLSISDENEDGSLLNKDIYFLCDKENNIDRYSYDELNSENTMMYIDNKEVPFTKFYSFDKPGEHVIRYYIKDKVKTCKYMFANCKYIKDICLTNFDASKSTSMSYMFHYCTNLTNVNFEHFNSSLVSSFKRMFYCCENIKKLNLSYLNSSNVLNMDNLFGYCSNLEEIDISNFNIDNVIESSEIMFDCKKLKRIRCNHKCYEFLQSHLPKNISVEICESDNI